MTIDDEARYEALRRRDPAADGQFYYAVKSTGIYCRPTCAARLALRKNVTFHATPEQAEQAGFRACRRCRPRDRVAAHPWLGRARAMLEATDGPVRLADLAAEAGLSPFHLQRVFKREVGMTPREYGAACRLRRVGQELLTQSSVTAAIQEAGYGSSSRFYEAGRTLGMTATQLRRGGDGLEIRSVLRPCSLGHLLVAATDAGVCGISLGDDPATLQRELQDRFPRATLRPGDAGAGHLADLVVELVNGSRLAADIPLDLAGTAFQQRVWRALRDVAPGSTVTYAELAARIGLPRAVRAVGTACGANPIAIVIPCHRVLRADGALGGYRWGVARKKALLDRERGR